MDKIDTSKEAVAKRLERLESLAERGWIDGDVVDLVSALSAERGQLSARLAACERERDEAQRSKNYQKDRAVIAQRSRKDMGDGLATLKDELSAANATITRLTAELEAARAENARLQKQIDDERERAGDDDTFW